MPKKPATKKQVNPTEPLDVSGVYLTPLEAARYIKLSKQYLEGARYRADGSGPTFIKFKRAVRYRKTDLDAWMDSHDHAPDKPL
jgi:hypothetical protein